MSIEQNTSAFPHGWLLTDLGECVDVLDSMRIPINSDERQSRVGDIPYYGATGQVGWINDYIFNEELVLLGEDGAPFLDTFKKKAYIVKGKSWVNNHAHVLRAINEIAINSYICHFLNTVDYRDYITGTTRAKLNQASMRKIPVLLPPYSEQNRIVAKIEELFTRLDAGVEELKAAKAKIKRYRQAVLKAAVEGKLTEKWREVHKHELESASKLLERIQKERKAKLGKKYKEQDIPDDNILAKIPNEWEWTVLENVSDAVDPQPSHRTPPEEEGGIPYVGIGDINRDGKIELNKVRYVSKTVLEEHRQRYVLDEGDFIIGKIGTLGRPVKLPTPFDYTLSANIVLIQPLKEYIHPDFVFQYMASPIVEKLLKIGGKATTQAAFGIQKVRLIPFPLPSIKEQKEIVEEVSRRFSVADKSEEAIDQSLVKAERLRQSILKKAFEGKLVPQDPKDEPAEKLLERLNIKNDRKLATIKKGKK